MVKIKIELKKRVFIRFDVYILKISEICSTFRKNQKKNIVCLFPMKNLKKMNFKISFSKVEFFGLFKPKCFEKNPPKSGVSALKLDKNSLRYEKKRTASLKSGF